MLTQLQLPMLLTESSPIPVPSGGGAAPVASSNEPHLATALEAIGFLRSYVQAAERQPAGAASTVGPRTDSYSPLAVLCGFHARIFDPATVADELAQMGMRAAILSAPRAVALFGDRPLPLGAQRLPNGDVRVSGTLLFVTVTGSEPVLGSRVRHVLLHAATATVVSVSVCHAQLPAENVSGLIATARASLALAMPHLDWQDEDVLDRVSCHDELVALLEAVQAARLCGGIPAAAYPHLCTHMQTADSARFPQYAADLFVLGQLAGVNEGGAEMGVGQAVPPVSQLPHREAFAGLGSAETAPRAQHYMGKVFQGTKIWIGFHRSYH